MLPGPEIAEDAVRRTVETHQFALVRDQQDRSGQGIKQVIIVPRQADNARVLFIESVAHGVQDGLQLRSEWPTAQRWVAPGQASRSAGQSTT